ncbi:MAG: hypothetical protein HQP61_00730 [Peptococcaceae bacterium]|nr:hypothetical protein [Candidatus Syntrophopropionicum ammoniitolerans]
MILYTPMQLELVLEGFDQTKYPEYKEIKYKGVPVLVEKTDSGEQKIVKLLSTDPADYLKQEMSPGSLIET